LGIPLAGTGWHGEPRTAATVLTAPPGPAVADWRRDYGEAVAGFLRGYVLDHDEASPVFGIVPRPAAEHPLRPPPAAPPRAPAPPGRRLTGTEPGRWPPWPRCCPVTGSTPASRPARPCSDKPSSDKPGSDRTGSAAPERGLGLPEVQHAGHQRDDRPADPGQP